MQSSRALTTQAKLRFWLALLPGLLLMGFLLFAYFYEWLTVGIIQDPATIASYPFGSEEAMSAGGWYYRDAPTYAQQTLVAFLVLLPSCAAFGQAIRHRSWTWVVLAYGIFVLTIVLHSLVNHLLSPENY
ncbi:hypothetical protein [Hymenobacter cellulosivorans]|uniref:DUF1634 domain-containing protein n=1 Tax=Hymenobacter cellulosivorans TaxID=2932249 RepID=A0ABY4FET3_9BACT|nr:hypothetical protein [Hymenobacter cellulosivorans]UOQ55193.1 hypothetical protein MUN80_10645 [Hymenobacter cellulosivorans]